MLVLLAGGTGGSRFLQGLTRVVKPEDITVIANIGDDAQFFGLHVSPDIDTLVYALTGVIDEARGWGIANDTFHCLEVLGRLGRETWFQMSDQDFAMHLHRTLLLRQGLTLSQATAHVTRALGIGVRILPMTDDPVQTHITTPLGDLPLQEYFVRERAQVKVLSIHFAGVERARPSPGVLEAIHSAQGIIIAPSNPFISIQPILSVPGIRQALKETKAPIVSVSPLVGGRAIKGPADRMMVELGLQPRAPQVAELYRDFLDAFIMDIIDQGLEPEVKALGIRCLCTNTLMKDLEAKAALAEAAMKMLGLRQ